MSDDKDLDDISKQILENRKKRKLNFQKAVVSDKNKSVEGVGESKGTLKLSDMIKKTGKPTSQQIIDKFITNSPDTVRMTTETSTPMEDALMMTLGDMCEDRNYSRTAKVFSRIIDYKDLRMIAHERKRAKEVADMLVAVMVEENRKNESVVDSIFKKRGS